MKKILVLDDDPSFLRLLTTLLTRNYEDKIAITQCDCTESAARLMIKEPFDLAIVDLNLPTYSGFVFLAALQKHSPNTKTIIVTGYQSEKIVEKSQNRADALFHKPIQFKQLTGKMDELLFKQKEKEISIKVETILKELLIKSGAYHVALVNEMGYSLLNAGHEVPDVGELMVLVASSMAAMTSLSQDIEKGFLVQVIEDKQRSIYTCAIDLQLTLVLVMPDSTHRVNPLGSVIHCLRAAMTMIRPHRITISQELEGSLYTQKLDFDLEKIDEMVNDFLQMETP